MKNSYNLIDEPFIIHFNKDGSNTKAGILDTFRNASKISRIGGDTPMHELTLSRLLLAIMYRALDNVQTRSEWEKAWSDGIPVDKIEQYLEKYRHRFDLLHPETPFYQIRGAIYNKAGKPESNVDLLIDHQQLGDGSKKFLFSSYKPKGYENLPFDVAARRLIELQAYNTASKKSALVGDTRTKKFGYAQMGWLGNFSAVMVSGNTLEQTLLLNFIPYEEWREMGSTIKYANDLPVWERAPQTSEAEEVWGDMDESRIPAGPADLYTHQISRVELKSDGEHVIGSVVGIGDRIFKYNLNHIEPMASWRSITRQDKSKAYVPVLVESRFSWKAVNVLFGEAPTQNGLTLKPGVFRWFDVVRNTVKKEVGRIVTSTVFTSEYGPQDAIIEKQGVSTLRLPQSIVSTNRGPAFQTAIDALKISEDAGIVYRTLVADLFVAEGKKPSFDKGITPVKLATPKMEEFYYDLAPHYDQWLLDVTNSNAEEKYLEWMETLHKFVRTYGHKFVETASRSAIAGHRSEAETARVKKAKKSSKEDIKYISAYSALTKFENTLHKKFTKVIKERKVDDNQ